MTSTPTTEETSRSPLSRLSPGQRDALSVAILGVIILLTLPGLYRYQGPPMEEGFMLAFPEQILKGNLPHKDFLHLYGPGSLWLLAAVFKVFGVTLEAERTVGLLQHLGTTFGLFFLMKPFGRRIATAVGAVSFVILIGPAGLSALAWNGALALGLCSLVAGAAATRADGIKGTRLAALSGFLAGAALLFRPDMVIAVGLGSIAMLFRLPRERRPAMVIAGVITLALYVPHFVLSGFGASFKGMFIEPVFKLRAGRTLPAPPSWNSIDGFLQRVGTLRTTGWPLPMLEQSHQIFIWFWLVPISMAVIVYAAWKLRRTSPTSDRTTALWPVSLFTAALITQALQRPDSTHLAWVSGISFALLIPAVYTLVCQYRPKWPLAAARYGAIALPVVILITIIPFYPLRTYADLVSQSFGLSTFGYPVERDGRVFYLGDPNTARDAQTITDSLSKHARSGQSLIVGPMDMSRTNYSDSYFYYLFPELDAGTRYIEMDPGLADTDDSGLAREIEHTDWLIVSDVWAGWTEPNDSSKSRSQAPNKVIVRDFCTVTESGLFKLLERCH